jgi:DNA-binding response OmpR family regulator
VKRNCPHSSTYVPSILCIDDDPGIQSIIELRMRAFEVVVHHAFYGMQGIWDSVRKHPDMILLDMAMPNGDGRYVLRCLRANRDTASVPIIVLTGMRDPKLAQEAFALGVDEYLRKPVSGDELIRRIGSYITLKAK